MLEVPDNASVEETESSRPWILLRYLLALGLIALVVITIAWLSDPRVMPLRVARIEGDFRYLKRAELERVIAVNTRGGFFSVDLRAIRDAAESLPWVAKTSVRRVWPDTLHIWVVERVAFANWGQKALITPDGKVFAKTEGAVPKGLPRLAGPEGSGPEVLSRFRLAKRQLQGVGLELVQVELTPRRAWRLLTRNRLEIHLGVEGFEQRLQRFVSAYPRLSADRKEKMRRVDMRYDNGMAIRWESAAPKPAAS
jgi:cell division protein FtsQ